jgi:hypothetical protein
MISKFRSPLRDCHQMGRGSIAIAFALLIGTTAITTARAQDRPFQFGLVGDTGYTSVGIEEFKRLLAAINRTDLAFVVHVGDFQADPRGWNPNPTRGPEPCTDDVAVSVSAQSRFKARGLILRTTSLWKICAGRWAA